MLLTKRQILIGQMSRVLIASLAAAAAFAEKVDVADGVWNFRGDFKIAHLLNLHTHATLFKTEEGFVMLDAIDFNHHDLEHIKNIVGDEGIKYFVHVHPFHTLYVKKAADHFPEAVHIGTERHHEKIQDVTFHEVTTEQLLDKHSSMFKDFDFSVPDGARLVVPNDDNTHSNSIFAYHKPSKTVHVDDSLFYVESAVLSTLTRIRRKSLSLHVMYMKALIPAAHSGANLMNWYTKKFIGLDGAEPEWAVRNVLCAHINNYLPVDKTDEEAAAEVKQQITYTLEDWKKSLLQFDEKHQDESVRM